MYDIVQGHLPQKLAFDINYEVIPVPMVGRKVVYRSFGLRIESELPLPELPLMEPEEPLPSPALNVSFCDLGPAWSAASPISDYIALDGETVYIRVPDTAIFAMRQGNDILISPSKEGNLDKIRLYVLGTCMGVILMQNRLLPLHGSAVAIDGKAYAIVGHSGAGKSTLTSSLLNQNYALLSDDLIALTLDKRGTPFVLPAYPQQKIWQETIDMLGMDAAELKPLFERETKFAVPVQARFCSEPLPLAGIIELVKSDHDAAAISPIDGLERFHTLLQHTFRGFLLKRLGLMEWHFSTLAQFANRIDMHRLHRPQGGNSLHRLHELMLQTIQKERSSW